MLFAYISITKMGDPRVRIMLYWVYHHFSADLDLTSAWNVGFFLESGDKITKNRVNGNISLCGLYRWCIFPHNGFEG